MEREDFRKQQELLKRGLNRDTYSQNFDMAHHHPWIRNFDNKDSKREEKRSISDVEMDGQLHS